MTYDHIKHYRTDTIVDMYRQCLLAAHAKFRRTFGKTLFYRRIPRFVKLRRKQDSLCPLHHTGFCMEAELARKRAMWHTGCTCMCAYCAVDGCNHGKSPDRGLCSRFSCRRCRDIKCPLEWNETGTTWSRPTQVKRKGGGLYWSDQIYKGQRKDLMESGVDEMKFFVRHNRHNEHHKAQMWQLQENLPDRAVIIKADFIQNIVHSRGQETSQSFYGKRQTQFLCFTVWYKVGGTTHKKYVDYLSSYLSHNSMYFQKCVYHLLSYLRDDIGVEFDRVCDFAVLSSPNVY